MKKDTTSESPNIEETTVVKPKFDPYEASLKVEEAEVARKTEAEDQETFAEICTHLKILMKEILQLKTEKPEEWSTEVENNKVKALLLMISLRRLSRIQKVRVKDAREKCIDNRQGVDVITLQLQNLLYEVSHLKKEVRKCMEFKSADTEIDLVPINQFYQEAPENISRPEETVEDAHQQRLAQLHWELEQRRGQTQLTDKLTQEKEKVAAIISEQESKLLSLKPRIDSILEATEPLQKALNLPLTAKKEQQQTSQLLPAPLYTLWVQASAYGEACDASLSVEIAGDAEAAKKLILHEEETKTDASDSEGEMDMQEENVQRKTRHRGEKRKTEEEGEESRNLKQLLNLHPLHVLLTAKIKETTIEVTFFYAQTMRIVTAKCSLQLKEQSKSLLTDILNNESLLSLLFPTDTGTESPNPATEFQLQKLHLTELSKEQLAAIGRPFKWAQTLAGLSFLSCDDPNEKAEEKEDDKMEKDEDEEDSSIDDEVPKAISPPPCPKQFKETVSWKKSAEHAHHIIVAIKRRVQARLALHAQFVELENATATSEIPVPPETVASLFPGKICSDLVSWRPIPWSDYEALPVTKHVRESGGVDQHFITFKADFKRQAVTLEAYVAVSPDYPNVAPVFTLKINWRGDETALTNPHISQMESELNSYFGELAPTRAERPLLLSLQLYRLAMCLDILTEASSINVDGSSLPKNTHFHKEKIFFRPARGPDRMLPFKYLPKLGVFAQR